jgi:hypothetical protein
MSNSINYEKQLNVIHIQEQLFYAVQQFDLSLIRELVAKGADINFLFNCTQFIYCSDKKNVAPCLSHFGYEGTTYLGFALYNSLKQYKDCMSQFVYGIKNELKDFAHVSEAARIFSQLQDLSHDKYTKEVQLYYCNTKVVYEKHDLQKYWNLIICLLECGSNPNIECVNNGANTAFGVIVFYLLDLYHGFSDFLLSLIEFICVNFPEFVADRNCHALTQSSIIYTVSEKDSYNKHVQSIVARKLLTRGAYYPTPRYPVDNPDILDWPVLMLLYCLEMKRNMVYHCLL